MSGENLVSQVGSPWHPLTMSTLVHLGTREGENLSAGLNQPLTSVFWAQPYAGPKRHQEALRRPVEDPTPLTDLPCCYKTLTLIRPQVGPSTQPHLGNSNESLSTSHSSQPSRNPLFQSLSNVKTRCSPSCQWTEALERGPKVGVYLPPW